MYIIILNYDLQAKYCLMTCDGSPDHLNKTDHHVNDLHWHLIFRFMNIFGCA